ncbi:MAG TPA: IS66 family transposase [Methanocella sp.]|jgi:transposase
MALTDEELRCLCINNPEAVIALIKNLEARIAMLEARLNQNSTNSGRPPSSDMFKPQSLRRKGERSVGGQQGHSGSTLRMVSVPDVIVDHKVAACDVCGTSLVDVPALGVERRQVFDIPPVRLVVSEHRAETKQCPCCHSLTRAVFPEDVSQPAQYGEHLKAFVVYLLVFQFVPYGRITELFSDLFGHSPCKATLVRMVESCYNKLGDFEGAVRGLLRDARVLHVDETGFRATGERGWLHVASTWLATWYGFHKNRGNGATRRFDILPGFTGTVVHDFWKPYFSYGCGHQLCNVHLIRELQGVSENFHQEWSGRMKLLLYQIKDRADVMRAEMTGLPLDEITDFESMYREIVAEGIRENSVPPRRDGKRGPLTQSKARNLVERCRDYMPEVLAFMHDSRVPFDNNQAERDIRMAKLQQKISGANRSDKGAAWFCRIRGYISTARKNGQPVLSSLSKAFEGRPFIPQTAN